MARGRLLGPVLRHLVPLCACSPIGLIPKPQQQGKWRLIVDLPALGGHSVNDSISSQVVHMSMVLIHLDNAAVYIRCTCVRLSQKCHTFTPLALFAFFPHTIRHPCGCKACSRGSQYCCRCTVTRQPLFSFLLPTTNLSLSLVPQALRELLLLQSPD